MWAMWDFFKGLIEECGMNEETEQTLRELIENKNYFGVEAMTDNPALIRLPKLFGSQEILKEAKRLTSNEKSPQCHHPPGAAL